MAKYWFIFTLGMAESFKNRKALFGLSIFLITCLIIFSHLWKVAAVKMGAAHLDPKLLLWFIALNEWVLISFPDVEVQMEQDLHSGHLAYLLPRPISYLGSCFAKSLGALIVNLLWLGAVAFGFTWWQTGMLPFTAAQCAILGLLGLGAGAVGVCFQMIIGLSGFWFKDVEPCYWIWEKSLFMLGGLLLPLSVYPDWIQKIAFKTPFPAILGQRSALALDFNTPLVLEVAASLLFWACIAFILLFLLYRRGLKILNVEGG